MTVIARASAQVAEPTSPREWPCLLDDTELIGEMVGSGFKKPPFLVRRSDGQVIQLSELLYAIVERLDGRSAESVAADVEEARQVRVRADQIEAVAEQKLAPLGLVAFRDGHVAPMARRNALLGLRCRVPFVSKRTVNAVATPLQFLFRAPIVVAVLAIVAALDVRLVSAGQFGASLDQLVREPGLIMALFIVSIATYVVHEFGHAAACKYGGAQPGAIGAGIYVVWPAFYTDVTDSYRLSRVGRLRVDLGGVYLNLWLSVGAGAAFVFTGYRPLLLLCVTQQWVIVDQFMPWMRLDGYHVISDLIGVPDLFARIGPILASFNPRRPTSARVSELKPWARAAVTVWVVSAMSILGLVIVILGTHAPGVVRGSWTTLVRESQTISAAWQGGNPFVVVNSVVSAFFLILPIGGILYLYFNTCRGIGSGLAVRRTRRELTLAAARPDDQPAASPQERAVPQPVT